MLEGKNVVKGWGKCKKQSWKHPLEKKMWRCSRSLCSAYREDHTGAGGCSLWGTLHGSRLTCPEETPNQRKCYSWRTGASGEEPGCPVEEGRVREQLDGWLAASHCQPITTGKHRLVLLCSLAFSMAKVLYCMSRRNQIGKYKKWSSYSGLLCGEFKLKCNLTLDYAKKIAQIKSINYPQVPFRLILFSISTEMHSQNRHKLIHIVFYFPTINRSSIH